MRKLLLLCFILSFYSVKAQIPIEGPAEDFTATDIDGNEHHLQDYLDDGKIVILDFFATWCPPCWSYHRDHIFQNIYKAYGPEGSDEIVVLSIECDPNTYMDDLEGTTENSQGDWLNGTPYPTIDEYTIQFSYEVSGYPTHLKICPDGSQYILQGPAGAPIYEHFYTQISGCAANGNLAGVENHAEITASKLRVCDYTGINDVDFKITNYGNNAITSFEASIKRDGTIIHSETFSEETIEMFSDFSASFSEIEFDSSHQYSIEITEVNGTTPFNGTLEKYNLNFNPAPESSNEITILVHTDNYPGEMTWDITDENDNVVISGGPYEGEQGGAGGGPDALTVKTHTLTIPEGVEECYHINMYDGYGDGWRYGNGVTTPGIEILSNEHLIAFYEAGNFGSELNERYAFKTNGGALNSNINELVKFNIYPNPSNGIFNIETTTPVNILVTDLTGKMVYSTEQVKNNSTINLSSLQKGMYLAKIESNRSCKTKKLIIK